MKTLSNYSSSTTVSVIIPTYNRAYCLPRAINSVQSQTEEVHEILVVDDGSNDGTYEVVTQKYPAVRLIKNVLNKGVSHARNLGVNHATGSHIAFLDSDDSWAPTKIEKQINLFQSNHLMNISHCDETWIKNGKKLNQKAYHKKSGGDLFKQSLLRCMISPSAVMIKKTLLLQHAGFDEGLPVCEDYDLWLRITSHESVGYLNEPLVVKYGGHSDQLSKSTVVLDRYRVEALKKLIRRNSLTQGQLKATIITLEKKLAILIKGAKRRGHKADICRYEVLQKEITV